MFAYNFVYSNGIVFLNFEFLCFVGKIYNPDFISNKLHIGDIKKNLFWATGTATGNHIR